MATTVFFDEFIGDVGDGVHTLGSDTLKCALSNTAPDAAAGAVLADITELGAGNGYTAGGEALTSVAWEETGAGTGVWRLVSADVVFTASGGNIGPFRYQVLYNDTPTSPADPLIVYLDYGSSITVTDGNTFTLDVNASTGWLNAQEQ